MAVSVITDSAAALPAAVAERAGIVVVPLRLAIGGRSYRDGELDREEVLAHAERGVSTSGPSPGDVLAVLEAYAGRDGTVVLTVAAAMSSTYDAARTAAALFPGEVRVIDTATAAGAQGLAALAAAAPARAGGCLDEVEAAARAVIARVRLVACLGNLEWLARSGRVPAAVAWTGRGVGLRFLFEFRGGQAHRLRPAFGDAAAVHRLLGLWRASRPASGRLHVAAMHGLAPQRAQELLDAVRAEVEPATALVEPFSPVMLVHTGPDLVGLAWWWEVPGA
ncbi:MAG TPA: DegV family protein [Actinomycetes bacterium]|jgi:DegV family protein with EDD domain|nr:DegV family protein [Actinomycetes bacterium]